MTAGTFALPLVGLAPTPAGQKSPGGRRAGLRQFVGDSENRLLEVVVQSAAARHTPFNPLVFYGPSGTGKSHVALGLARAWKAGFPNANVVYLAASDLTRYRNDASQSDESGGDGPSGLAPAHRAADYLVIDNVDTIGESPAAQNELAYTIDAVCQRGGRIVLTAALDPARNSALTPRLRGRLSAGLVTPISPPGLAARSRILRELATAHGIALSACCIRLLADSARRTVPELLGLLLQLELEARSAGRMIEERHVAALLDREPSAKRITIDMIALAVAKHFHVKVDELRSPSRRRTLVLARGVAVYLARKHTRASFVALGKSLGGRDHTTVMHAYHKIAGDVTDDPAVAAAVSELESLLGADSSADFMDREPFDAGLGGKLSAPRRRSIESARKTADGRLPALEMD